MTCPACDAELERVVQKLTELASLQARQIDRLSLDLELGIRPGDMLLVEKQAADARQLALAALSTSGD